MTAIPPRVASTAGRTGTGSLVKSHPVKFFTNESVCENCRFSRPLSTGSLRLYTVAGELVLSKDLGVTEFQPGKSQDKEWVYEYSWNLTNSEGAAVAPGVYLYVAEGVVGDETQIKVGKLAIIP